MPPPEPNPLLDIIAGVCLLVGAVLALAGAIGLLRFPDALSRLHAGAKPQVLGVILVVVAVALSARSWFGLLILAPIVVFQLLTIPVAAHMIARAGYRTKNHRRDLLVLDELEVEVERASARSGEDDEPEPVQR